MKLNSYFYSQDLIFNEISGYVQRPPPALGDSFFSFRPGFSVLRRGQKSVRLGFLVSSARPAGQGEEKTKSYNLSSASGPGAVTSSLSDASFGK